ncbi:protein PTCD3 homolog, mitochondrial [Episyrphus balteatus]|uniref:protein PTCD3 homolog, mitochondrial n=1 Tax=Episyrphus balteatus TaxID=286459 RepID=UPI002485CB14|nr:protein PTCD3 homolog, mitochondrial [Episyrphus balteatus]
MFLSRPLNKFTRLRCQLLSTSAKTYLNTTTSTNNTPAAKTSSSNEERIEIPNRIPRSSTDILLALSSTVKSDPTAVHFKYHDDPYLIPMSNVTKRTFAMAQEAGRKAAKWVKDEHGRFFMHQEAQPSVEAFGPKMVFNEESEVDETSLQNLIHNSEVTDAVFVYNLMKTKNLPIADDVKQSLLELICFYNNEEPIPEEFIEERWFNDAQTPYPRLRKTWKDGDLAEQIFNELEPKTPKAYAAIIRGMAKFGQAERAYALFQDATEKQIELDTKTFNSIICIANFLKETADHRWDFCQETLQQMNQQELKPDLGTLNALLQTVGTFGNFKLIRGSTLKVLSTFKKLGVEPSLATYYYVLNNFCRDRSPTSHVIVDILNEIEGKDFTIAHPKDINFFVTAMDVCRNHLHDRNLAKRVDALLHTGNNYDLIGDSYKEGAYYRHMFALLSNTEPLEEFMVTYDRLVPNIYIPEPGIMEEILKSVEVNGAIDLMPRLWSDIISFDLGNRENIINRTLKITTENRPNPENPAHNGLNEHFARIALDIYTKVIDIAETRAMKRLQFTGQMIGDILTLTVRGGDFEMASKVFETIDKEQHKIPGTPSDQCTLEFVEACVVNKAPSLAVSCLQYAVENNMESMQLARIINKGFTLNEVHLSKLKSLVGDGFLAE